MKNQEINNHPKRRFDSDPRLPSKKRVQCNLSVTSAVFFIGGGVLSSVATSFAISRLICPNPWGMLAALLLAFGAGAASFWIFSESREGSK
jgi:F0F1-type ATP synthase assembly protein I